MFNTVPEYSAHIISEHTEVQDYILCPVEYCKTPIRCLVSHFKLKHPHTPIPKRGLLKATIFRDFTTQKGRKKVNFKKGYHHSTKMNKAMYYRSGYEEDVYKCLDKLNDIVAYEAEPFKIPYMHEGVMHEYTPDIFVSFADGHCEVWEIKPQAQTSIQMNKDKWSCAEEVCLQRGWKFKVIVEQEINKLKKKVTAI